MDQSVHCARQGTLVVSRSDLSNLSVTGPDRSSWLNGMVTCDVSKLALHDAVAGLALTRKGKILSDVFATARRDCVVLGVHGASAQSLRDTLDQFLIMEDAEIRTQDSPLEWAMALGPLSDTLVSRARAVSGASASVLRLFGHVAAVLAGPAEVLQGCLRAWSETNPGDSALLTWDDFEAVRIDLGVPRFGPDYGDATYPQEAGLDEHFINFNKGCYLGQEVVVKMRSRGHPSRLLVRIRWLDEGPVPKVNAAVLDASGESVGSVTSSSAGSLNEGRPIAFAMVRYQHARPGHEVRVDGVRAQLAPAVGLLPS